MTSDAALWGFIGAILSIPLSLLLFGNAWGAGAWALIWFGILIGTIFSERTNDLHR